MEKFFAITTIALITISCTGMDMSLDTDAAAQTEQHALIDEFISAAAAGDEVRVQAMLEHYEIPQELIDHACSIALEHGNTALTQLLRSQRAPLESGLEKLRDELHTQTHPEEQRLISAIEDDRLEDIRSILEQHSDFNTAFIGLKMFAMLRTGRIAIAQLLYEYMKAPVRNKDDVVRFCDTEFEATIKLFCLTCRYDGHSEEKVQQIRKMLELCPPSTGIWHRLYDYAAGIEGHPSMAKILGNFFVYGLT